MNNKAFEIKTVKQLRLFNTPETRGMFEAMLDTDEGVSAREVGLMVGVSPESAHYHLGKLLKLGLVEEVGLRDSGARPERLFGLKYRSVQLKRGKRSVAYIREMIRGVRLLLRKSEREYEQAWDRGHEGMFRPRAMRAVAWLSEGEMSTLHALEGQLNELFAGAERVGRMDDSIKRERMAIMITLSSVS